MIDRRHFLLLMLGLVALPGIAAADDDGGGGGNSGNGGGGNSGPGGGDDGGGNSGPGGGNDDDDHDDHERAREARERGDAESLRKILAAAKKRYGGRVVDVRLRKQSGRLFYDIKLVGKDGTLRRLKLDAKTGSSMSGAGS